MNKLYRRRDSEVSELNLKALNISLYKLVIKEFLAIPK